MNQNTEVKSKLRHTDMRNIHCSKEEVTSSPLPPKRQREQSSHEHSAGKIGLQNSFPQEKLLSKSKSNKKQCHYAMKIYEPTQYKQQIKHKQLTTAFPNQ